MLLFASNGHYLWPSLLFDLTHEKEKYQEKNKDNQNKIESLEIDQTKQLHQRVKMKTVLPLSRTPK